MRQEIALAELTGEDPAIRLRRQVTATGRLWGAGDVSKSEASTRDDDAASGSEWVAMMPPEIRDEVASLYPTGEYPPYLVRSMRAAVRHLSITGDV